MYLPLPHKMETFLTWLFSASFSYTSSIAFLPNRGRCQARAQLDLAIYIDIVPLDLRGI